MLGGWCHPLGWFLGRGNNFCGTLMKVCRSLNVILPLHTSFFLETLMFCVGENGLFVNFVVTPLHDSALFELSHMKIHLTCRRAEEKNINECSYGRPME